MAELADALVLGTSSLVSESSNLSGRTNLLSNHLSYGDSRYLQLIASVIRLLPCNPYLSRMSAKIPRLVIDHSDKSKITTDPNDPRLGHGIDDEPRSQNQAYLVLSEKEKAKGFVRPYRERYIHTTCGTFTKMHKDIAESFAVDPRFYGATYCVKCQKHLPLHEFEWEDGQSLGT